ncbi:MAG: periplasmic heavy metal sensor [Alphaproteobacteria bacterium]|nr:periplasmic heavy metal sensor [Alphaproteobacteria bacterium SS10]
MSDSAEKPDMDDAPLPGADGQDSQPKKQRRWPLWTLVGALLFSLSINLALGGFIAGRLSGGGGGGGVEGNLRRVAMTMEHQDRKILRQAFMGQAREFRQLRQSRRMVMREVRQALEAEPFDRQALETAMAKVQTHIVRGSDLFQGAIVDAATNLSPDARGKLAGLRLPSP